MACESQESIDVVGFKELIAMRFALTYRGPLPSSGSAARVSEKHAIRRQIHPQLRKLWRTDPLGATFDSIGPNSAWYPFMVRQVGGVSFLPLVLKILHTTCELDIQFLRPGKPGRAVSGGDIDNRIKTLLDGLRRPSDVSELPSGIKPEPEEQPFFCLLEDDGLVSDLRVRTEELLTPTDDSEYVELVINTNIRALSLTAQNFIFGS